MVARHAKLTSFIGSVAIVCRPTLKFRLHGSRAANFSRPISPVFMAVIYGYYQIYLSRNCVLRGESHRTVWILPPYRAHNGSSPPVNWYIYVCVMRFVSANSTLHNLARIANET
jgi:hypothetical protein